MLVKAGSFCSACMICVIFTAMLTSKNRWFGLKFGWLGRERWCRTSDRKELNAGNSWVFSDWLASGEEIENCDPVEAKGATSGFIVGGWLVGSKDRADGSLGEAGLEGIFGWEAIGDRKVTTELVGRFKLEGVRVGKSPSGSERTERQSSQGGKIECNWALKF